MEHCPFVQSGAAALYKIEKRFYSHTRSLRSLETLRTQREDLFDFCHHEGHEDHEGIEH